MDRVLGHLRRGSSVDKQWTGVLKQNLEPEDGYKITYWGNLQGFVNQESETKRILVSNAAGRDMNTNTGRKSLVKNQYVRIGGIVQQYNTLPINFLPPPNSFATLFSPHYFSYVLNFSTPLLNLSSFLFPH